MKKLTADLPEKVASTSGRGEISTYRMPHTTTRDKKHLRLVDTDAILSDFQHR